METGTTAPPGRPRDERIDAAVVAATTELLAEHGYHRLSITKVAARAGTTTQAIYRRWASKQDLVLDAVFGTSGDEVVADSGSLAGDITSMVRWAMQKLGSPLGRAALAGLLGDPSTAGPHTAAGPHTTTALADVWDRHRANLERWRERGLVRADVDVTTFLATITGPALLAGAVLGMEPTDDVVERLAACAVAAISPPPSTGGDAR